MANAGDDMGRGEDTESWEDMNNEEDIDDGEYVENDGIIKHYYPSKSYIETTSPGCLKNAICGAYCIAYFPPSANGQIVLDYLPETYTRNDFPEDKPSPGRSLGIFVRKSAIPDHSRYFNTMRFILPII